MGKGGVVVRDVVGWEGRKVGAVVLGLISACLCSVAEMIGDLGETVSYAPKGES